MSAKPEWADKDYYADLGVSSSAEQNEIKRAYRKLARENHPDTHPDDPAAAERFKKVAEAYDVLSDASERKEYDQFKAMLRNGGGFGRMGGAGFPGGFRSTHMGGQGAQEFDLSDLFGGSAGGAAQSGGVGDIFGSVFNRGGSAGHSAKPSRGADVETEITLDFREAAKGTTIPLALSGNAPCTTCHGSGSASGKTSTCGTCSGTGFTSENRGAFGFSAPCKDCDGTGRRITDPCKDCHGTGTVHRTRNITVRIPAGVDDARALRDAVLQTRDDLRASVAGLESQARAQGHLLNQIARACNGAARHGVPTGFDEHLIAALSDEQERLSLAVVELASVVDKKMADLNRKTRR